MLAADCRPDWTECFPRWRTQTVTVENGKIIELQTSGDFNHRLNEAGDWASFD